MRSRMSILFGGEFVLLESIHELRRQAESAETQSALSTAADVVHQSDCSLVQLLLVKVLILDHVQVEEVAHVSARVPPHILSVDIDFTQHANHLGLIDRVGLCTRSSCRSIWRRGINVRFWRHLDDGERERIGDLERASNIQPDERPGHDRGEVIRAVLDDFHNHLLEEYC